jgi:hypothetical protein
MGSLRFTLTIFYFITTALVEAGAGPEAVNGFLGIAERFGVPVAFALLMFVYFSRMLSQKDKTEREYRDKLLNEQTKQTDFLRTLVNGKFQCGYSQGANRKIQ